MLCYQNVLNSRTHVFYNNCLDRSFDIIMLTETWHHDSVLDSELCSSYYSVVRCDKKIFDVGRSRGAVF